MSAYQPWAERNILSHGGAESSQIEQLVQTWLSNGVLPERFYLAGGEFYGNQNILKAIEEYRKRLPNKLPEPSFQTTISANPTQASEAYRRAVEEFKNNHQGMDPEQWKKHEETESKAFRDAHQGFDKVQWAALCSYKNDEITGMAFLECSKRWQREYGRFTNDEGYGTMERYQTFAQRDYWFRRIYERSDGFWRYLANCIYSAHKKLYPPPGYPGNFFHTEDCEEFYAKTVMYLAPYAYWYDWIGKHYAEFEGDWFAKPDVRMRLRFNPPDFVHWDEDIKNFFTQKIPNLGAELKGPLLLAGGAILVGTAAYALHEVRAIVRG
jgi:hypothetical protein